jgi:hypothetical protein
LILPFFFVPADGKVFTRTADMLDFNFAALCCQRLPTVQNSRADGVRAQRLTIEQMLR